MKVDGPPSRSAQPISAWQRKALPVFAKSTRSATHRLRCLAKPVAIFSTVLVVLGVLVFGAAGAKAYELITRPPSSSAALAPALILVSLELLVATWLVFGARTRRTWGVALATFSAFAAVSTYKTLANEATCGCFGAVELSPAVTAVFDIITIAILCACRPPKLSAAPQRAVGPRLLAFGVVPSIAVIVMAIIAQSSVATLETVDDQPAGGFVVLEPNQWVGARFELLRHIDLRENLRAGEWTVLLVSRDCGICRSVVAELAENLRRRRATGIAVISTDGRADQLLSPLQDLGCAVGHLRTDKQWLLTPPLCIRLSNGVCTGMQTIKTWKDGETKVPG